MREKEAFLRTASPLLLRITPDIEAIMKREREDRGKNYNLKLVITLFFWSKNHHILRLWPFIF